MTYEEEYTEREQKKNASKEQAYSVLKIVKVTPVESCRNCKHINYDYYGGYDGCKLLIRAYGNYSDVTDGCHICARYRRVK
jgi:hypothetical protein